MAGKEYLDKWVDSRLVRQNRFIGMKPERKAPPSFADARPQLPVPRWEGHDDAIACWWKVWEIAFRNIKRPTARNGFVANYIDTAFNDHLFMWDTAFILLFARYGARAFEFQRTLDNMYCKQHPDGFICREIREEDGTDMFHRFDPSATGPAIMPWTEYEYFLTTGDRKRLAAVFPPLAAFHKWMRTYRTWPDGSYWATGWACGMDNQPRPPAGCDHVFQNGHMAWIDTCLQQLFSADVLARMATVLGRGAEMREFGAEHAALTRLVNGKMWDARAAFYKDRLRDGTLSPVKTIGAYWALLAGAVPAARLRPFVAHLDNPREFRRAHRVPTLSADHGAYRADGGYWCGGVWPPTNYMVLRGLSKCRLDGLAHAIAMNHHANVVEVFRKRGTVFENYAPEYAGPGNPAKGDFVGWGGLGPVAVFLEYVLGIRSDVPARRVTWDVRLVEGHGVTRYPFGVRGELSLYCRGRRSEAEPPAIEAASTVPVDLVVRWKGGTRTIRLR